METDSRAVLVEEHCSPARYKSWLSGEPQEHEQDEDGEHCSFCKFHPAQLPVLLSHDIIRLLVSVSF